MTQRRIFLSPESLCREGIVFPRKTAHYLRNVLRLRSGDCVEVFAGERQCIIRLAASPGGELRGEIVESKPTDPCSAEELVLAFSCVRPGPVEEILRHGTELGVTRFVPILSTRANRRPPEIKPRWESIVAAAAAQSRRGQTPLLSSPSSFDDFIQGASASGTRILLSTDLDAEPLLAFLEKHAPCEIAILVGPEGGLETGEEMKAVEAGFHPVSLGAGVLRTETAAVVAAATVTMWRHWSESRGRKTQTGL
ncbi:MAG: 16S rRNA (uracil(1498)-N(3))-methyltransferase [Desulfomonile tiedjei]|nr:16S rRNA (uracil(1498)-N(3))-methyltransferase [Desulfomonile tiedjei]